MRGIVYSRATPLGVNLSQCERQAGHPPGVALLYTRARPREPCGASSRVGPPLAGGLVRVACYRWPAVAWYGWPATAGLLWPGTGGLLPLACCGLVRVACYRWPAVAWCGWPATAGLCGLQRVACYRWLAVACSGWPADLVCLSITALKVVPAFLRSGPRFPAFSADW